MAPVPRRCRPSLVLASASVLVAAWQASPRSAAAEAEAEAGQAAAAGHPQVQRQAPVTRSSEIATWHRC
jgi:hypothetical protein